MAAYDNLRAVIAANVYQNNNNEVTADMVKAAMNAMVASLGAEFQYGGVAEPTDNPGTPDYKVAYLASTPGTYTNFGGLVVADGEVAVFKWGGTAWSKEVTGAASAENLDEVRTAISNFDYTQLTPTQDVTGKFIHTDGSERSNANCGYYKFAVTGGGQYAFSGKFSSGYNIYYLYAFDSNGDFIGQVGNFPTSGTNYNKQIVTAPANAAFITLNYQNSFKSDSALYDVDATLIQSAACLRMRGSLPSCDLNDVLQTGTWILVDSNTYTNAPDSATLGFLRVSAVRSNWVLQEFFAFAGANYYKRKINIGQTPEAWVQVGGTETINNYYNTYNVAATPTITTDTNQYLAASGDTTDRTLDILTMLQETGVCRLGPGTFYVDGLEMPDDTLLIGSGNSTRIRLIDGENKFAVKMGRRCTIQDIYFRGGESTPTFGATSGTRHAIIWQGDYTTSQSGSAQPQLGMISNCRFVFFSGSAILCSNTGPGTYNHIEAVNCTMRLCWAGINISYYSEFHKFTNIRTSACYYGAINNGGNNVFVNCDFSSCTEAFLIDNSTGQSPNNSHGSCIGCLFNHSDNNAGVGIRILGAAHGFVFSGCQIFYSKTAIDDSDGIVFSACNYGNSNCDISVNGGGAVLFIGNMYKAAPPITITNNSHVVFANCYVSSTGAVVSN